ncbi:hypothetical protein NEOC65_000576, partial [Neochlamydia sp. AcF65]|nr:hypothetical protein [Neochlamydia sp. AcF65]
FLAFHLRSSKHTKYRIISATPIFLFLYFFPKLLKIKATE